MLLVSLIDNDDNITIIKMTIMMMYVKILLHTSLHIQIQIQIQMCVYGISVTSCFGKQ